ncbi:hypothetical protein EJ08DRAFT_653888 [Tothia fuscella]|uniref:Uncharacterized protein n=1 Tax=Tothia fuscella TaxID=1048955 RepID=A0A9P4TT21_9PEZI|nr:hypothetical protein EJ08DRAFT_653888 [Tothia fuscella]
MEWADNAGIPTIDRTIGDGDRENISVNLIAVTKPIPYHVVTVEPTTEAEEQGDNSVVLVIAPTEVPAIQPEVGGIQPPQNHGPTNSTFDRQAANRLLTHLRTYPISNDEQPEVEGPIQAARTSMKRKFRALATKLANPIKNKLRKGGRG